MKDQSNDDILHTIRIIEKRLATVAATRTEDEITVFPDRAISLYHCHLGNSYLELYQRLRDSSTPEDNQHMVDLADKCVNALEKSVQIAALCLEITEPQRLFCIHSMCKSYVVIRKKPYKAKLIAEKTFENANLHTNNIEQPAVEVLQKLRDDFMTFVSVIIGLDGKPIPGAVAMEELLSEEELNNLMAKVRRPEKKKNEDPDKLLNSNRGAELVRRLKRIISLPLPVQFESIPSASFILRALDRIFRAYVRGNALPGQLTGGHTVDLDGKTLSFRTFILHGPYMSWRGFLSFLYDFAVAKPPLPHTRSGKNYLHAMHGSSHQQQSASSRNGSGGGGGGGAAAGGAEGVQNGVDPPLELKEAGVIFIEASHSATPALVMNKYLKLYGEIAENLDYDPWGIVIDWANDRSSNEWYISAGLNFMQFLDCLGKIGAVAYSSARFAEMLPTTADKIEHFLSAYLGLSDERKWKSKVDNKLRQIKSSISKLTERAKSPTKDAHTKSTQALPTTADAK